MSNIITCEQVSAGHPDKICDQIADAVVTDCLRHDKTSRVAIEVLIKDDHIVIAGELTSRHSPNYHALVSQVFDRIGKERLGYDADKFIVEIMVSQQSPDIAAGVDTGGAGDQGMMFGYASNETIELLPVPFILASKFLKRLAWSTADFLRADAKAQVSFDYDNWRIETFLCSVQTAEDADPAEVRKEVSKLMKDTAAEYALNTDFEILVNPTGKFEIGGPFADTGVTGRKLACDTYGGVGHIGGGAMCVDGDTEFLTPYGWKPIKDYCGDCVGQWKDGELSFVKPTAYIKSPADGLIRIKSAEVLDMVLSPDHDVVIETSKRGLIKKPARLLFDENGVRNGNHGFIPTSFRYEDNGAGLLMTDDQIRLQVAFCADGTILKHKEKWTGRIRVKKESKKSRMRHLLAETDTEYKESEDGEFSIFFFCPPFVCKKLSECLMGANSHQLSVIADEVQLWDGDRGLYRTTIKADADFVQFAFMAAYSTNATMCVDDRVGEVYGTNGQYARKSVLYEVRSTKRTKFQVKHGKKSVGCCDVVPFNPDDGMMYCFSVPSGMLVLRRNGRVFVTGNSGKDPTKVDRSGAYAARKIAVDIVRAGFADRCEVQIAYAIGVAKPVSIHVETFGTEHQEPGFIEDYVRNNYDLTPKGIIKSLDLLNVDYNEVSTLGHFGKNYLPWEE